MSGLHRNSDGICEKKVCPENSYFSDVTECCICNEGFILNPITGECDKLKECPKNSKRIQFQCICDEGYHFNGQQNECIKCLTNEFYDGIKCVCQGGYIRN